MDEARTRRIELWMATANTGGQAVSLAREAEAQGFDGVSFGDTQCQNPDAFIGLTIAAAATTRLQLAIGVTNPVTRHPAVLACAIATVQHESGGRAILGIGRGDSAVTKIGLPAATATELEHYIARLQSYLSGAIVEEDGPSAQLAWIDALSVPKVPVDVAATGPAVIGVGARLAERVTFNVGADPDRVRGSLEVARRARREAGLAPDGVSFGAYVNVAPHPDRDTALELIKPVAAVYARFSRGLPADQVDPEDRSVIRAVDEHYDMSRHGRGGASHLAYLTDNFLERFGVAGTPEYCIDRLAGLAALGLDRLAIVGPTRDAAPEVVEESRRLLFEVVFPGVRQAVARHGPA
ncbi:MAG: LLM class flavin-dependent oxidoreductase [Acidimicrobiales bacterium]